MLFLKDPVIWIKEIFISSGLNDTLAAYLSTFTLVVFIVLLSWLSFLIAKAGILRILPRIVKTTSPGGVIFPEQSVFSELSHLAPALVIWLIQSEIFEYLLAIMDEFELKVYQQPAGNDLLLIKNDLVKPLINN